MPSFLPDVRREAYCCHCNCPVTDKYWIFELLWQREDDGRCKREQFEDILQCHFRRRKAGACMFINALVPSAEKLGYF